MALCLSGDRSATDKKINERKGKKDRLFRVLKVSKVTIAEDQPDPGDGVNQLQPINWIIEIQRFSLLNFAFDYCILCKLLVFC